MDRSTVITSRRRRNSCCCDTVFRCCRRGYRVGVKRTAVEQTATTERAKTPPARGFFFPPWIRLPRPSPPPQTTGPQIFRIARARARPRSIRRIILGRRRSSSKSQCQCVPDLRSFCQQHLMLVILCFACAEKKNKKRNINKSDYTARTHTHAPARLSIRGDLVQFFRSSVSGWFCERLPTDYRVARPCLWISLVPLAVVDRVTTMSLNKSNGSSQEQQPRQ